MKTDKQKKRHLVTKSIIKQTVFALFYRDEFVNVLRKKELATEEELQKLGFLREDLDENYFTSNGGAMLKWWIPINWASRIIQKEQLKGKY